MGQICKQEAPPFSRTDTFFYGPFPLTKVTHSSSLRLASRNSPCRDFQKCTQNDVTMARHSWGRFYKKPSCILLVQLLCYNYCGTTTVIQLLCYNYCAITTVVQLLCYNYSGTTKNPKTLTICLYHMFSIMYVFGTLYYI